MKNIAIVLISILVFGCVDAERQITDKEVKKVKTELSDHEVSIKALRELKKYMKSEILVFKKQMDSIEAEMKKGGEEKGLMKGRDRIFKEQKDSIIMTFESSIKYINSSIYCLGNYDYDNSGRYYYKSREEYEKALVDFATIEGKVSLLCVREIIKELKEKEKNND